MKRIFQEKKKLILLLGKYAFSMLLIILAFTTIGNPFFFIVSVLELGIIIFLTNWMMQANKIAAYLVHFPLILLFHAQQLVMYFGSSYTTLVMVTNLESLESLGGRMIPITIGVLALLFFSLLPVPVFSLPKISTTAGLSLFLMGQLAFTFLYGNAYSPLFAVYRLGLSAKEYRSQMAAIANQPNTTAFFYKDDNKPSRDKPTNLPHQPNIVLIFTEGLSQNIIDDPRQVMPSVQALQDQSLNFEQYYNHTFATYRALIGQLYSGYQLNNYDTNSLISLQDILAGQGYSTSFVNTEPTNTQFTSYLESMNFQEVVTDAKRADGINGSLTDKTAFELLFETMEEQAKTGKPFFTSIYTYGTHMSFDSPDQKFGDGKHFLLNRFYNFDYYFKEFLQKFENSSLADNTILVFTADHATFEDSDFKLSYPDYPRANPDVDTMPFFIYHKGIQAETINAEGRNSLSMAPTLLDYLDIDEPNYFLGESLFYYKENNNSFDTVFHDNAYILSTDYGQIGPLSETNQQTIEELLQRYFAAKTQVPQKP